MQEIKVPVAERWLPYVFLAAAVVLDVLDYLAITEMGWFVMLSIADLGFMIASIWLISDKLTLSIAVIELNMIVGTLLPMFSIAFGILVARKWRTTTAPKYTASEKFVG